MRAFLLDVYRPHRSMVLPVLETDPTVSNGFPEKMRFAKRWVFLSGGEKTTKETVIKTNLFGWHTSVIQALGRMAWEDEEVKVTFGYIVKYVRGQPAFHEILSQQKKHQTLWHWDYIF